MIVDLQKLSEKRVDQQENVQALWVCKDHGRFVHEAGLAGRLEGRRKYSSSWFANR